MLSQQKHPMGMFIVPLIRKIFKPNKQEHFTSSLRGFHRHFILMNTKKNKLDHNYLIPSPYQNLALTKQVKEILGDNNIL